MESFHEDHLYQNLEWLSKNQGKIEKRLLKVRHEAAPPTLYLYDVTRSYLEGPKNVFPACGYHRDGKKGKKQIVVGLLTEEDGTPVAVRVFEGNTSDPKTVESQIQALAENFGAKEVTLVGDRGMLKSGQIVPVANGIKTLSIRW